MLGARSEPRLLRAARLLDDAGLPYVAVYEPDAPYHGAMTAIGLWPLNDVSLARKVLSDYHMVPLLKPVAEYAEP